MAENATNAATQANGTEGNTNTQTQAQTGRTFTDEELAKHIQSETDKRMAEYGKKSAEQSQTIANLQAQVDKLTKDKMSAEDRKKLEDEEKAQQMAEKDRLLTERENRLTAIDELTKASMYKGDKVNAFVDLVIKGSNAEEIAENVKTLKAYIDEQVAKGVDETFKTNGRNPNGGSQTEPDKEAKSSFAIELGKKTAETAKKSNDILNHYIGGKN